MRDVLGRKSAAQPHQKIWIEQNKANRIARKNDSPKIYNIKALLK